MNERDPFQKVDVQEGQYVVINPYATTFSILYIVDINEYNSRSRHLISVLHFNAVESKRFVSFAVFDASGN